MNDHASIHAQPRFVIATDAAALILVELLLFAASRVRILISPLAFLLLAAGTLAGFAADVGFWFWRGVRAADIADDVLTIYSGRTLSPMACNRSEVRTTRFSRLPGGRKVLLRTWSGRRVRISETAFPREEFTRFFIALEEWAPK